MLEFERPICELEEKIQELRRVTSQENPHLAEDVARLEKAVHKTLHKIYHHLTPWQTVQIARHMDRPQFLDYVKGLFTDFVPLAGDRLFSEDTALIGGLARLGSQSVMVMGHQKGHGTDERIHHHFGMPRPEGYRKAQRLMKMADQFQIPVIAFIDTAGAYPGIGAEERGQAEAIARCLEVSLGLSVPIVSIVIGEGGSGGAIAIGVANEVLMLQYAVYSVISPEGCASILWKTRDKAPEAAAAQKMTAPDLLALGIIDAVVPEPIGAAHRHPHQVIRETGSAIQKALQNIEQYKVSPQEHRLQKFLAISNR